MYKLSINGLWPVLLMLVLLTGCNEASETFVGESPLDEKAAGAQGTPTNAKPALDVYKSPTCGCCSDWMKHMDKNGFQSVSHNLDDLSALKSGKGIHPRYQSCHTAVSTEGYVFEGHVPARFIKQFLEQRPEGAIGLAVPGMPMGSPGMELGDRFAPYEVLLLKSDGTAELYARVEKQQEQY